MRLCEDSWRPQGSLEPSGTPPETLGASRRPLGALQDPSRDPWSPQGGSKGLWGGPGGLQGVSWRLQGSLEESRRAPEAPTGQKMETWHG